MSEIIEALREIIELHDLKGGDAVSRSDAVDASIERAKILLAGPKKPGAGIVPIGRGATTADLEAMAARREKNVSGS